MTQLLRAILVAIKQGRLIDFVVQLWIRRRYLRLSGAQFLGLRRSNQGDVPPYDIPKQPNPAPHWLRLCGLALDGVRVPWSVISSARRLPIMPHRGPIVTTAGVLRHNPRNVPYDR
jgi:hypothetical protein